MTKAKRQAAMIARAGELIDAIGAMRDGAGHRMHGEWVFMTEGGVIQLTLSDDCLEPGKEPTFTLFTRFMDSAKAKNAGFLERYSTSRKWNHHGIVECDELAAILERVTRNAPHKSEQPEALLPYRMQRVLQRLMWKAGDYSNLLQAEARESEGYREQLKAYIADAQQVLKESEAANG